MDPKEYMVLCKLVAQMPGGELGIKKDVPKVYRVVYNGTEYYPVSRTASFDASGQLVLTANLHDIKANTLVCASLEKVSRLVKD